MKQYAKSNSVNGVAGSESLRQIFANTNSWRGPGYERDAPGKHDVPPYTAPLTFMNGLAGFVLNQGQISDKGIGVVVKDKRCKSTCLRYSLTTDWRYSDEIDWNSYKEIFERGYVTESSSVLLDIYHLGFEGPADLLLVT